MTNQIYPCLWFDGNAKSAADLYCSVFDNSKITTDTPMVVKFELNGFQFMGLNGGPRFQPNPSISFFVICKTEDEVNKIWEKLSEGGTAMIPLGKYPWSERYGWIKDVYMVTWQIMLDKTVAQSQTINPSMLFTENSHGKGNAAIDFYVSLFNNSAIITKVLYEAAESNYATQNMIKYSLFSLNGKTFSIMDAGFKQPYTFNEGISFVVECNNQEEIDYYWNNLTKGGNESMCGWLKDQFGVSWQIAPKIIGSLMTDPEKGPRVMQEVLKMKKLDIQTLINA